MFSSGKLKTNNISANSEYSIIYPSSLVDPDYEVDVMFLVNTFSPYYLETNYSMSLVNPVIRTVGSSILQAWPKARMGLAKWSGFTYDPPQPGQSSSGHTPYTEVQSLQAVSQGTISSWNITNTGVGGYYYATTYAIKNGAESGTFGWRSVVPGRKKFMLIFSYENINLDEYIINPPGYPSVTRAEARDACINNQVFPIWCKIGGIYSSANLPLGYGIGLADVPGYYYYSNAYYGQYRGINLIIPEILGAIYNGIVS